MMQPVQKLESIQPFVQDGESRPESQTGADKDYAEGKRYLEKGELSLAVVSLHNALIGYEEKNDDKGMANASHQLGKACFLKEDYEQAQTHFLKAESLCVKLGDPMGKLTVSRQLIDVYSSLQDYDKAIDECIDVLDLYQANNNPQGSVDIIEKMAEVYIAAGDTAKAADAYRTIASIHQNFKHDSIAASYREKAEELGR